MIMLYFYRMHLQELFKRFFLWFHFLFVSLERQVNSGQIWLYFTNDKFSLMVYIIVYLKL